MRLSWIQTRQSPMRLTHFRIFKECFGGALHCLIHSLERSQQDCTFSTELLGFGSRNSIQQHDQLGRAVLRQARAAQRLAVCKQANTMAEFVPELLTTNVHLAIRGKNDFLDGQNRVDSRHILNEKGGASETLGSHGDATVLHTESSTRINR